MDILALTETHINEGSEIDDNSLYEITGYDFVKNNRKSGIGGGVACLSKKNFLMWGEKTLNLKTSSVYV